MRHRVVHFALESVAQHLVGSRCISLPIVGESEDQIIDQDRADADPRCDRLRIGRECPFAAAKALSSQIPALQRAIGESWGAVQGEARGMRRLANELLPTLSSHDFSRYDAKALTDNVISLGLAGDGTQYSVAEQATMVLASIASALKSSGGLTEGRPVQ
jgi:hypothetical protein